MDYQKFSNKIDLFNYLNSGIDKSGNLKKEGGFKKDYPLCYNEYIQTTFPEEIDKLSFKQKLWHFLNDIYVIPKCKICGKEVSFETRKGQWGYHTYCSGDCAMHDENVKQQLNKTKELLYGDKNYNNKEKLIDTLSKKTDDEKRLIVEKSKQTRLLKNDGKYFSDETISKIKRRIFNKSFIRNKYIFKYNFKITEHQLVEYCLNNSFPGNSKWTANHPIWKCYVPGQPSPYIAWFNEKYLKKAVNNMFKLLIDVFLKAKKIVL